MSKKIETRINENIRVPQVRLINADGDQVGVVDIKEALSQAVDSGLDLVEISPNAAPPVCRVMDYGKFLYQKSKEKSEAKKKQKQTQMKEIKIRPGTEEGDYQIKLKKIRQFLEEGNKVKISLRFRGREMSHKELGLEVLKRIQKDTEDLSQLEHRPEIMGRQMIMVLGTKRK